MAIAFSDFRFGGKADIMRTPEWQTAGAASAYIRPSLRFAAGDDGELMSDIGHKADILTRSINVRFWG